MVDKSVISYTL